MRVGINLGFGNLHQDLSDADMFRAEANMGVRAEELGFDTVWAVEHHFDSYSMCPDNIQLLSWVAARTERIGLGTGAVILPWHDPLRVAEKLITLDILSNGRAFFGLGRGLSRREYEPFRISMGESRGRFDEAAQMILSALETGVISGDGPFYPQPKVELRPAPEASFADRIYCVAGSPDSLVSAVAARARLLAFVIRPVEENMPNFTSYRDQYRTAHGVEAPPIAINLNLYCHSDGDVAKERANEYISRFFYSNVEHYEMAGEHFKGISGYGRHDEQARQLREFGLENAAARYSSSALVGTPDQIIEKLRHVQDVMGTFELQLAPSFGAMPHDEANASLELFAKEVLPAVKQFA
ncbi:LLM class flavin-dependent oxidoreductase [Streptomyces sp. A30]|uniref:LLM class flavin-dependent oxidoreductase n=1 Tax=Streptomyces sp. A30 TaxID=2789273 RepID=UPI00397F2794